MLRDVDFVMVIVGVIFVAAGLYPLIRGRNYPGVLGRSFTKAGTRKFENAPAEYWRALGAWMVLSGLVYSGLWALQITKGWAMRAFDVALLLASIVALVRWVMIAHSHALLRWPSPDSARRGGDSSDG